MENPANKRTDANENRYLKESLPRHTHFPPYNERDCLGTLAMLYQSLTRLRSGPRPDAQDLQDFPRWQILEDELSHVLLFRCQFDRTPFKEKTP